MRLFDLPDVEKNIFSAIFHSWQMFTPFSVFDFCNTAAFDNIRNAIIFLCSRWYAEGDEFMRILFFSDVHGSPESLRLLLCQAKELKPDLFVLLGDVLYHGPRNPLRADYSPGEVVSLLNPLRDRLLAVRGNCDAEVDQLLLEFPIMSDSSQLFADGCKFFLTHGHLWSPEKLPPLADGSVFAFGHIHLPVLECLPSGITAFNPGSISLPKGGNPASFGFFSDGILQILNLETGAEMSVLSVKK